jgi:ribonuclease HII
MLQFEQRLWDNQIKFIAGIDEVGRGCLFGDVVAAAVILPKGLVIEGIDDSKKLTEKKRDLFYDIIQQEALAISVGYVDSLTVDRINIKQAARLAMKQALEQLVIEPDYLLVDAEKVESKIPQESIIHGDALSQSIAAASIIAKVTRDRMCIEWDKLYSDYGIAIHKGYATKLHRERILEHGPSPLHRKTFLTKLFHVQQQLF